MAFGTRRTCYLRVGPLETGKSGTQGFSFQHGPAVISLYLYLFYQALGYWLAADVRWCSLVNATLPAVGLSRLARNSSNQVPGAQTQNGITWNSMFVHVDLFFEQCLSILLALVWPINQFIQPHRNLQLNVFRMGYASGIATTASQRTTYLQNELPSVLSHRPLA